MFSSESSVKPLGAICPGMWSWGCSLLEDVFSARSSGGGRWWSGWRPAFSDSLCGRPFTRCVFGCGHAGTEGLGARSSMSGKGHHGYWEEEAPVQLDLGIRHPGLSGERRGEAEGAQRVGYQAARVVEKVGSQLNLNFRYSSCLVWMYPKKATCFCKVYEVSIYWASPIVIC